MAKRTLVITSFEGGISPNEKQFIKNSARFIKNLNPFEDPSYITLAPKTTKVSGSTVTGIVKWIEDGSPHDTNRYFYDDGGKIYRETSGGTWSSLRTVSSASGNGLLVFDDYLYYSLDAELGRYGKLSGTPSFSDSFLSDGTTDKDQSGGGTGGTDYVPPTSISEAATARQTFTPQRDPLKAVIIDVDVVGTGDWTVTVHDKANNSIGTKGIVNASMTTGDVTFTFATPLRVIIGNEYHFHVTSTVADGGVDTGTATDLEDAEFSALFGILISDTNFHPILEHLNGIVIGNERYLAFWDQATYNPNQVSLAPGFNVRTLTKIDEFVIAGCWRGTSIDGFEEGRLYWWDGISPTFNFYRDVMFGLPNALYNSKNRLLGIYGSRGDIYIGAEPFERLMEAPKLARGKAIEVFPGAVSEWLGNTVIGIGANTDDSTGLEQGVYTLGRQSPQTPEGLVFSHAISTGTTQATTLEIGAVKGIGKDLYIGWRDNTTYGVDKIIKTDNAAAQGEYESLIFDGGNPDAEFLPLNLTINFETLATNESVTPKYKKDRAASFTAGTEVTSGTRAEDSIYSRVKELEFGFTLKSSDGTYPKVTSIELEYDDLIEEIRD